VRRRRGRAPGAGSPALVREDADEPFDPFQLQGEALDAAVHALRERIAELLSPTPIPRDELIRITGAPAPAVYAALTELALADRAELLAGVLVVAI
jgi:DNA processing protein